MYVIKPATFNVGTPHEWTPDVPERTFRTAAGLLRWALDARQLRHGVGGVPYPTRFDDKWLHAPGTGSPGADYWVIDTFSKYKWTPELIDALRRASWRYREIIHHLREVDPDWGPDTRVSEDGRIYYADNSIVRYERSRKYPKLTRSRTELGPGGDASF